MHYPPPNQAHGYQHQHQYPQQYGYPPPHRPPSGGGGGCWTSCLIVIAIFGAITIIVGGVVCASAIRTPEEARRAEEKDKEIAAAAASLQAFHKAQVAESFAKGCKREAGLLIPVYDDDLKETCRDYVRASLTVAGSGDFPSSEDSARSLTSDDGCRRIFESYVEAQNAFGVRVRTAYRCTYDPRTGGYAVKTLP